MVASLQQELAARDIQIRELDETVENLSLMAVTQSDRISEQDKELHLAYYCFGTKKELKEQNILSGGGLFSKTKVLPADFNREYFMSIDIRDETEFHLYSRKAKIQSNHPGNSYHFKKDPNGNMILVVFEPELFWSLSKYLVIEVG